MTECERKLHQIHSALCNLDGSSKLQTLQTDITKVLDNQTKILDNQKTIKDVLIVDNTNQIQLLKNNTRFLTNEDGESNLKFTDILDLLRDPNSSTSYLKDILEEHQKLKIGDVHILMLIFQRIGTPLPFKANTIFEAFENINVNPNVTIDLTSTNSKIELVKSLVNGLNTDVINKLNLQDGEIAKINKYFKDVNTMLGIKEQNTNLPQCNETWWEENGLNYHYTGEVDKDGNSVVQQCTLGVNNG